MWRLEPPAASGRGSVGHAPEPEDGAASHRGHGRAAQLTHARQPHHGPRREVVVFEDGEEGEQEPRAGQHPTAVSLALLFTSYFVHLASNICQNFFAHFVAKIVFLMLHWGPWLFGAYLLSSQKRRWDHKRRCPWHDCGRCSPGAARLNTAAPCLARRGWAGTLGFVSPYSDHQLSPSRRCKSHRYQPGFSLDNDDTNGTAMIVLVTIWSWYFTFHTCAPVN